MWVGDGVEGLVATRRRQCGVALVISATGGAWWSAGDKVQVGAAVFVAFFSWFALWFIAAGLAALRAYFSRPRLAIKVSQQRVSHVQGRGVPH